MESPEATSLMHRAARIWAALPGLGFKLWFGAVAWMACLAAATDWSFDPSVFFVGRLLMLLTLPYFAFVPGLALWVSVRHLCRGNWPKALTYGLVPVVGTAFFMGMSLLTQWGLTEMQIATFTGQIEAAKASRKAVQSRDTWIDPGPPARAKFVLPSLFVIRAYMLYDEADGSPWLQAEAQRCKVAPLRIRPGFFQIVGQC